MSGHEPTHELTFEFIWEKYIEPLEGTFIRLPDRTETRIAHVGPGGLARSIHHGPTQHVHIEVFRQAIGTMLREGTVGYDLVRMQFSPKCAETVFLVFSKIPIIDIEEGFRNRTARLIEKSP